MYKILLLTDFSAVSKHAIAFAQALYADATTEFCLLHTFALEPVDSYGGTGFVAGQRGSSEKTLKALLRKLTRQPVPPYHTYRTLVMPGDPVGSVEMLLTQEHFDLVVVGATGAGNSEFFGSVATGLLRAVNTNVLIVPASAPIRPLERLVLATDYQSVNDAQSFGLLKDLASRKAVPLTLLTIENPRDPGTKAQETSRQYVMRALETIQVDPYVIHDDDVRHGINAYLDTHAVDLLVLLPHHNRFFDVVRHASVSRSVVYHPRVPVLTLYDPAPAEERPAGKPQNLDSILFATYV